MDLKFFSKLVSITGVILLGNCALADDKQETLYRWITITNKGRWPAHTFPSPDSYQSSVALAWGSVLGRAMNNRGKYTSAWFPYKGMEYSSEDVDQMQVLTYKGGLDQDGYLMEWRDIELVKSEPNKHRVFEVEGRAPCVLDHKNDPVKRLLGICDLVKMAGVITWSGQIIQKDQKDLENGKVLCVDEVKTRKFEITQVPKVDEKMVRRVIETSAVEEADNDSSSSHKLILLKTFENLERSSYSHDKLDKWRQKFKATIEARVLSTAINKYILSKASEHHGKYTPQTIRERTEESTFIKQFSAAPHKHVKASVVIYRETMKIPYKAKETFFGEGGKELGSKQVSGVWEGVSTFPGAVKIKETPIH